jgi:beta-galactosidase
MLLSYDSRFAFQVQGNNPQFSYYWHFNHLYRALHRRNVSVDIVAPADDLSGYKLVLAPALHVVSEAEAENLRRFIQAGGVLLVTPRSGVKDQANSVVDQPLPGLLSELCGVEVEDYDSLMPEMKNEVEWSLPGRVIDPTPVEIWCDILRPTSAQAIAHYRQDFYAGKPAVTLNLYGEGQAVYAGTMGGEQFWDVLVGWLVNLAGLRPVMDTPPGVEAAERWQGEKRLLFLLNHTAQEQTIEIDAACTNLLDGGQFPSGKITISPRDGMVLMT